MRRARSLIIAAAVTAATLGLGAAPASAYSISGGIYTGTANSSTTFKMAGYTVECTFATTYSGTASGSASTSFTPAFSGCGFVGFPATISQSGSWSLTINGSTGSSAYQGGFYIPWGSTTTITIPLAGCTVTIPGGQSFPNAVTALNAMGGAAVQIVTSAWMSFTASSGCPFTSGSFGEINLGVITMPGVTFS